MQKKKGFATNRSTKGGAVISLTNLDISRIKAAYDKKVEEYKVLPLSELREIWNTNRHNNKKLSETYRDALLECVYPKVEEEFNTFDLSILEEKYVNIDRKEFDKIRQIENQITVRSIITIKEEEYNKLPLVDIQELKIQHSNVGLLKLYEDIRRAVIMKKENEPLAEVTDSVQ